MNAPSIKRINELLGNEANDETAAEIRRIWTLAKTGADLDKYESVFNARMRGAVNTRARIKLLAINDLIKGYGVEEAHTVRTNETAEYINTGDTYNLTVVLFRGRLKLTTWGDFVERARVEFA